MVRSEGDEGVEGVGDVAGEPEVAGLGKGTGTVGIQDGGMGRPSLLLPETQALQE